jgi:hydrophobic/amphiphilic exporter-1 (mainly G- bacteria), HAE1 family
MISKFFINRPIFASVISLVIVFLGLIAIPKMAVEKTPDIVPPTVVVSATYPGASAEVVAETIAAPLEEQINGVDGMLYMSSSCSNNGSCSITVTFEVGTDADMAAVLVQNRVAMAEPSMPEEVKRQGITTQKRSGNIALMVCLVSPEKKFDEMYMSNYVNIYLKDVLSRVKGVGGIMSMGAKDFSMRIWMNPELLKARGLTAQQVIAAIQEQNAQVSPGEIGTEPVTQKQAFQYTIRTMGRLENVEQFENIVLKVSDDRRILHLKDVAKIELGAQNYSSVVRFNGTPCVMVGIMHTPGANALEVANGIQKTMNNLAADFPDGLEWRLGFNPTKFISESLREVILTLVFTVVLVVLVVFIFLQDWRTTLIPTVAIPVSLIGTFAVMSVMGMSINTLTLFGLVLAIGILVDDAILVVENVMRLIEEEHLSPKDASIKAMQQVTGPVIATTLVLLAVFIPTTLVGGVSGRLYSQFALTISTAVLLSSVNALTLSPALCAMLFRPSGSGKMHGWLFRAFNRFMDGTRYGYMAFVGKVVRSTLVSMALFGVLVFLTLTGILNLNTGFLPDEDEGNIMINVELPTGASLQRTCEVIDKANQLIKDIPGISEYLSIGGFSMMGGGSSSNTASLIVSLTPWSERKDPSLSITSIMQQIQQRLSGIVEARCIVFRPSPIMGLGMVGGFEIQLQDRGGAGLQELQQVGGKLVAAGQSNQIVTRLNSSLRANVPQVYLDIDREKTKQLGVSLGSVFNALQSNFGTYYINDLNLFGKVYRVQSQAQYPYRATKEDILRLEVANNKGDMVPLRTIASVKDSCGPQSVSRYNLYNCTTITGTANPGYSSGQAMNEMKRLLSENLPQSMGYEWSGMSLQEIESGNKAPIIFGMAAVFAFLVLAAQYESWFTPLTIILSVPIAVFGAVLAIFLRAYENNVYVQIGMVLLIGLACKTAILIVEFAKQHHEEGLSIVEAAILAAKIRFRPILMTALTTIAGVLPLMIATGAGSASRRSLGTAVCGGMLLTTILGIFLFPVLYIFIQNISEKIHFGRSRSVNIKPDTLHNI